MTQWVGILNITPDSFSDGGVYVNASNIFSHLEQMLIDGATICDIGAESTRPHATPITSEEEWQRLSPYLAMIISTVHAAGGQVSLDTRHGATAKRAIDLGVDWINDVSGATCPELLHAVANALHIRYILMHSLGIPASPTQLLPDDTNLRNALDVFFTQRLDWLESQGIGRDRVILDVGLGFGKSKKQSLELLWDMPYFKHFGLPLLVGHSRKSMFSLCTTERSEHDALTLLGSSYLIHHNIDYLRVHNIARHATLSTELSTRAVHKR